MRNYGITNAVTFILSWNKVVGAVSAHFSILMCDVAECAECDDECGATYTFPGTCLNPEMRGFLLFWFFLTMLWMNRRSPRGARWACFVLVLGAWGLVEYFIFFLSYFLIACILGKEKKKTTRSTRALRQQQCEVNIFHGGVRKVEK